MKEIASQVSWIAPALMVAIIALSSPGRVAEDVQIFLQFLGVLGWIAIPIGWKSPDGLAKLVCIFAAPIGLLLLVFTEGKLNVAGAILCMWGAFPFLFGAVSRLPGREMDGRGADE